MKAVLPLLALLARGAWAETCPNMCSQHGNCDRADMVCECGTNWWGGDCSLRVSPTGPSWNDAAAATDDAHNDATCSDRGTRDDELGQCVCDEGFEGVSCSRMTCSADCNGHGVCMSMSYLAQRMDPGAGTVYSYDTNWDADMIYGCVCDHGYAGFACEERECPRGDDPLTGTADDPDGVQVNEIQAVTCTATSGTFTLSYKGETTVALSYAASISEVAAALENLPTLTSVSLAFEGTSTTACTTSGNEMSLEFVQDFGDVPLVVADDSNLAHSGSGKDPSITVVESQVGTKEDVYCSGRGTCDTATGYCTCYTGYDTSDGYAAAGQRGDCGYPTEAITACPGEITCSGHGVCSGSPTYECACASGWTGGDCSERTCPYGPSWFEEPTADDTAHFTEVECSNRGSCDRSTGECACSTGFTGSACERIDCPGGGNCNSHGQCLSMAALAEAAIENGAETDRTYGATPNDQWRWDHSHMYGCFCDDGYEGYDCSLRSCVTGDDPLTSGQSNEVQQLVCDGSAGQFSLIFRQATTASLDFDADEATVEAALEALDNVIDVTVSYSSGTDFCTAGGANTASVTFLTNHGDLPDLSYEIDSGITSIAVTEYITGTKEDAPCSNRGLCDYSTGVCECFTGFGSSDGHTNESGELGDCGYMEPYQGATF